jgi:hypothetical protein
LPQFTRSAPIHPKCPDSPEAPRLNQIAP